MNLDKFDRSILQIVQQNNQLTHSEIGDQVGLSNSAVRRRLKHLRDTGVIARDVSIISNETAGVTMIVNVTFAVDTPEAYAEFDRAMTEDPHVKQVYHVSGTTDYVLIVQGPSLSWYEDWAKASLMSDRNLRRHDTSVVYSCKKFDTASEI
ncbi:MAG: Lrp/AsnC family transcriptional regulator [Pseudomonadota bacterium]